MLVLVKEYRAAVHIRVYIFMLVGSREIVFFIM